MDEPQTPSLERAGRASGGDWQVESAGVGAQERALQALSAASEPREAVAAVESLRASLWQSMLAAVRDPSAADVAALADRVAQLCSALLSASLSANDGAPGRGPEAGRAGDPGPLGDTAPRPPVAGREDAGGPQFAPAPSGPGVIVDERAGGSSPPSASAPGASARVHARSASIAGGGEIAVRDERAGQEGAAPWIAAISRRLRDYEQDHRPFAVLLMELRELDRLRATRTPQDLEGLSADVAHTLAELLAGDGQAPIAQGPGRYWVIARARDASSARVLARRIADALGRRVGGAGSLLVGIAVCPVNARSAAGLAAHADVDLYAARGPLAAGARERA